MEIRKIYEYALQREYEGKNFFLTNAERLHHAAARGAFLQLAGEEQKHIDFIQSMLDAIDQEQSSNQVVQELKAENSYFSRRAFSEGVDQSILEAMVPDLPILRMAYLIERDFAEFYEMAASKTEGDAKQILEMLGHWERGHEQLFRLFHDKAFEQYAQMPWGG